MKTHGIRWRAFYGCEEKVGTKQLSICYTAQGSGNTSICSNTYTIRPTATGNWPNKTGSVVIVSGSIN